MSCENPAGAKDPPGAMPIINLAVTKTSPGAEPWKLTRRKARRVRDSPGGVVKTKVGLKYALETATLRNESLKADVEAQRGPK